MTAAWANGETMSLPRVRRRPSVMSIAAGAGRGLWAHARGAASDVVDVAGLGLLVVGVAHLPGTWGEVGAWVAGGLALLITSAKLSA